MKICISMFSEKPSRLLFTVSTNILVALSIFWLLPTATQAAITPGQIPTGNDLGIQQESPVRDAPGLVDVVRKVVVWTYTLFFILAVLLIIFAAFAYLTAGNNAEQIKTAHKRLIWAAVAIVVALLAVGAELIIKDFLNNAPNQTQNQSGVLNVSCGGPGLPPCSPVNQPQNVGCGGPGLPPCPSNNGRSTGNNCALFNLICF